MKQFNKKRAELIAKINELAIQINEQGKVYANAEVVGHCGSFRANIFTMGIDEHGEPSYNEIKSFYVFDCFYNLKSKYGLDNREVINMLEEAYEYFEDYVTKEIENA